MKRPSEFVAVLLSGDHEKWFPTEKEAWDYIYSLSCDLCKNSDMDACAAEWDVWTREEWEEFKDEEE